MPELGDQFCRVYPYQEERRSDADSALDPTPLQRPAVWVRLGHEGEWSYRLESLVDSGCDRVLAPRYVADLVGVVPDPSSRMPKRMAGRLLEVELADVDVQLLEPAGILDAADPAVVVEWRTEVGFYTGWNDPPWLVVLGQRGFFDEFTVVMSRLSLSIALRCRDHFDHTYPAPSAQPPTSGPARFAP